MSAAIGYGRIGAGTPKPPAETSERRRAAIGAWSRCDYIAPGPITHYLQTRHLGWLAAPKFRTVLRQRLDARHPNGTELPALVALVSDPDGDVGAIHRIFLRPDGGAKTDLEPRSASFGPIAGGAIRLADEASVRAAGELIVGEGLETAAAAAVLLRLPAWSAIAAGNLGFAMVLPAWVERVVIAVDRDPPGIKAANDAARRWRAAGKTVRFLLPNQPGADAADLLGGRRHA
jgi:putative DNA primase/helicase